VPFVRLGRACARFIDLRNVMHPCYPHELSYVFLSVKVANGSIARLAQIQLF
jgi:hypothetical protein